MVTRLYEHDASVFAGFGGSLRIHANRVVPPGGADAAALWEAAVGEKLDRPASFLRLLYGQDEGRLAYLYDTISEMDAPRAAFALGLWIKDPAARMKRFKALAAGESNLVPAMAAREAAVHPAALRCRLDAGAHPGRTGRVAVVSRGAIVVELGVRRRGTAAARGAPRALLADDGPVDAAWLAEAIASGDVRTRSERLDQFAFGQRAFGGADRGAVADVLTAIRAFPRYRMLMLTLEQMGVRRASVYAAAARRAQQLSPLDGDRAFVALGQFQGALALIARLTRVRTLDVAAAEALVTSLSSVPLNQDGRYAGGVASWMQQALRPAIPRADDIDNALFPALAGAPAAGDQPRRLIDWEGQRYRLDPAVAEEQRLRRVREKQQSASLDQALTLLAISRKLSAAPLAARGRGGRRRDAERAGSGVRAAGRRPRRRVEQRRPSARRRRSRDRGSRPDHGAGRQLESRPDRRGARRHRRRGAGRRADGVGLRHLDYRPGESGAADRPRHPPPRFRPRSRRARPSAAPGVGGAQGGGHGPGPMAHQRIAARPRRGAVVAPPRQRRTGDRSADPVRQRARRVRRVGRVAGSARPCATKTATRSSTP